MPLICNVLNRYIFNVGEGFQRFCVEHKVKLAKMSGILATRVSTEAIGGLPGEECRLAGQCLHFGPRNTLASHSWHLIVWMPQANLKHVSLHSLFSQHATSLNACVKSEMHLRFPDPPLPATSSLGLVPKTVAPTAVLCRHAANSL